VHVAGGDLQVEAVERGEAEALDEAANGDRGGGGSYVFNDFTKL
jgi:hypothetical protein